MIQYSYIFTKKGAHPSVKPRQRALLERARRMLADAVPTSGDCGELCGAACCRGGDGMWLFPGEADFYADTADPHFSVDPSEGNGDYGFLRCTHDGGGCDRDERPLACRIFPYFPMAVRSGRTGRYVIRAVVDPRAARVCPLLKTGSPVTDPRFRLAVRRAGRLLMRDRELRAYLIETSDCLTELFRLIR